MDSLQPMSSRHSISTLLPSTSPPCPRWPLHCRHDGKYCLCWRHCQTRKIPLDWWTSTRWCCHSSYLWLRSSCCPSYCYKNIDVDREYLAVWRSSCFRWLHPIRHSEGFTSCKTC